MKRPRSDLIAIVGILLALVGIVFPIIWDRYRARSSLELQFISLTTLVEKSDQLDKLSIIYNGENLNQISRAEFILVNSGRVPIVETSLARISHTPTMKRPFAPV
jgi:hypothetical protein